MSWPSDGKPRFIVCESTGYVDGSEQRTEIMVLDRAYNHQLVYSTLSDPSMTNVPLHRRRAHAYLVAHHHEKQSG